MTLLKLLFVSTFVICSSAIAAEPAYRFEINDDQKSFHFTLENLSSETITCSKIEITAKVGDGDDSEVLATYKLTLKNQVLKPNSKIENSNVGIDFLAQKAKNLKNTGLIYYGQYEVLLNCK